jgi:purine-nucleoside phosphorylase
MGFDEIDAAADFLGTAIGPVPEVAVVLGSGLGDFASGLADSRVLPYGEIPHWPVSTVIGHAGQLVAGNVGARRVIALAGRSHFYEGYSMEVVTFATRVLGRLGVKVLILTNAAGGINLRFSSGALMLISDHINFMGTNPLVGPNDERLGVRFPDMSEIYSPRLRALARKVAQEQHLPLEEGVYVAVHGPSYETPAEIRAFRALGADAVGMSTAPEAIVARHMGIEVLGVSCITNMAAGVLPQALVHDEVMETARRVRGSFIALLEGIIGRL